MRSLHCKVGDIRIPRKVRDVGVLLDIVIGVADVSSHVSGGKTHPNSTEYVQIIDFQSRQTLGDTKFGHYLKPTMGAWSWSLIQLSPTMSK